MTIVMHNWQERGKIEECIYFWSNADIANVFHGVPGVDPADDTKKRYIENLTVEHVRMFPRHEGIPASEFVATARPTLDGKGWNVFISTKSSKKTYEDFRRKTFKSDDEMNVFL